ncbi:unnamed protein product [Effrenium voratum]|uniref:Uncharacterized protein n=1 Tax=Effrenium voratum TaxID=2562239 RepID=A0AA36IZF3_9DINO|nr:unnamed protein product [Effrenium voratum]
MVPPRKLFLLILNFLSLVLFSGTVFGWTALSQILVEENFYDWLCDTAPCDAQTAALDAAFTLASTAYGISALPGGLLLDKAGPLVTIIVGGAIGVLSVAGIACLRFTFHTYHVDLFPVFLVGVAVGGSLIRFCGYSVGFLFPSHSALLIATASVLFDGSCLVFPLLRAIFSAGVGYEALFGSYAGFGLVLFILLPIAWKMNMPEMERVRAEAKARQQAGGSIETKTILQQMKSLEFLTIFLFSTVQLTHSNLYIGSVNDVNAEIAEKSGSTGQLAHVNTIVSFVIPMGFVAVPAITASIRRFGNVGTLQITNVLGILVNLLQMMPSLWLQAITVCLFATFRAYLFSNVPQFNAHYFGVLNMGRIQGICFLSGGLLNLVQVPLINYSLLTLKDFTLMLVICIVATLIPMIACVALQVQERRKLRESLLRPATPVPSVSSRRRSASLESIASMGEGIQRSASLGVLASAMHGSSTSLQVMSLCPSSSEGSPENQNHGLSMVEEAGPSFRSDRLSTM